MTDFPAMERREFLGLLATSGAVCLGLDGRLLPAGETSNERPILSFGVLADAQYCDGDPQSGRYYRESLGKLDQCVKQMNTLKPDFTIQLGDIIQNGFASYDVILPVFDALAMPRYHVLGNHDADVEPGNKGKILQRLGLDKLGDKKGYYDFGHAGWRFVVLNGNDICLLAYAPGSPQWKAARRLLDDLRKKRAANAQDWNGALGDEQQEWLSRTLAGASRARERIIVFCHFPVYPPGIHTLWNDSEILEILDAHSGIVAYLNGHNHAGGYGTRNGIHYLTFKGMVETTQTAYALVQVYPDRLRVTGFGRETRREITCPRSGGVNSLEGLAASVTPL